MKLIIGLGNPGKQFDNTRHNAGFLAIDKLQESWDFPAFEFNKKFNAELSKSELNNHELLLVKPQTFMNLSGETVQGLLDFYKLTPEDIIVLHDDLDISTGKYKIATDSSSAGHNGVQDIIDKIGTQKFLRIRIGIRQEVSNAPVCRIDAKKFVLQKISSEELEKIEEVLKEVEKETIKLLF